MLFISAILRRFFRRNNNHLLAEREGRTGEYWPEVVTVRIEHREVRTKTTDGQYSPVRLEQARLVSSLLYGTRLNAIYISFKRTSSQLNSKDFGRVMTRATQKEQATFKLPQLCKTKLLKIFRTFYQRNLRLSFLGWEPKCGDNIHHTVLSSATGLESPKSLASDRASFFGFVFVDWLS